MLTKFRDYIHKLYSTKHMRMLPVEIDTANDHYVHGLKVARSFNPVLPSSGAGIERNAASVSAATKLIKTRPGGAEVRYRHFVAAFNLRSTES